MCLSFGDSTTAAHPCFAALYATKEHITKECKAEHVEEFNCAQRSAAAAAHSASPPTDWALAGRGFWPRTALLSAGALCGRAHQNTVENIGTVQVRAKIPPYPPPWGAAANASGRWTALNRMLRSLISLLPANCCFRSADALTLPPSHAA